MRQWRASVAPKDVKLLRRIGEGNFGHVYLGVVSRADGKTDEVVLKKVKRNVEDAHLVADAEAKLNRCCSRNAPGCCPPFLGAFEVQENHTDVQLSPGHWLVWEFEGVRTLADYWKGKHGMDELAMDLFSCNTEEAGGDVVVVAEVMRQLLGCLVRMHGVGLVHRDVKPANMVFSTKDKKFKLIDLGAMADLRTGTNYVPTEAFLDPSYCPPEQYVMPVDSPHLQEKGAFASMAMSPVLWAKNQPDKFDAYSAGIILLQLAVPCLRKDRNLKSFNTNLARSEYDLLRWRAEYGERLSKRELTLLDADDRALLQLAASLLREKVARASCTDALRSPFLERNKVPRNPSTRAQSVKARNAKTRGSAEEVLAAKIAAAKMQKQSIEALQSQGASPNKLVREEEKLRGMQQGVKDLLSEYEGLLDRVARLLKVKSATQPIMEDDAPEDVPSHVNQLDISKYMEQTKSAVRMGGALTGLAGRVAGDLAGALGKEVLAFVEAEAGKSQRRRTKKAQHHTARGSSPARAQDAGTPLLAVPPASSEGNTEEDMIATEGWEGVQVAADGTDGVDTGSGERRGHVEVQEDEGTASGTVKRGARDIASPAYDPFRDSSRSSGSSWLGDTRQKEEGEEKAEVQRQELLDNVQVLREQVEAMEAALAAMATTMDDIQSSRGGAIARDVDRGVPSDGIDF